MLDPALDRKASMPMEETSGPEAKAIWEKASADWSEWPIRRRRSTTTSIDRFCLKETRSTRMRGEPRNFPHSAATASMALV